MTKSGAPNTMLPLSPGRVLIADDVPANLRLLKGILEVEGFTVDTAPDGPSALAAAAVPPDVVLLDVMMPGMDGFEVCRRLRAAAETAYTPIVMVTALHESADRVRALEAGADDFLTKPVEAIEVVARVTSLVRAKRDRDALEATLAELRRVESMRDSLSQMLVHDLRTPLTSMLASTEMLRTYYGDSLDDTQRELVGMCRNGCSQLLELINELLDVAKLESGELHPQHESLEVRPLLEEALDQVRGLAAAVDVRLHLDTAASLTPLRADGPLLRRVLVNLLGNAIKHSPARADVRLSAKMEDGAGNAIIFGVQDNGPGIRLADRGRIFDKWGQVEARAKGEKSSSGLGLTFCRLAVEAHRGHIWVVGDEEVGIERGSVFYVRVPVR